MLAQREEGLFGPRISRHFGFRPGSVLTVRSDEAVSAAITHLHCERLEPEASPTPPVEAAFSLMVQLAPLDWHELTLGSSLHFSGFVPAGAVSVVDLEERPKSRMSGRFDGVQFYVRRAALDDLCRDHRAYRVGRLSRPRAEPDGAAMALTLLLLPHLRAPAPDSVLFVQHLTTAFLAHAIQAYGGVTFGDCPVRGGLAAWQEKRVKDLMRASLAQPLAIADLASECRLTDRYFAAAFKMSFGVPPHRYLTRMRLNEAKRLLRASDMSLIEVAEHCGFGSQSHLTRAFTQSIGYSPGTWRRACKP